MPRKKKEYVPPEIREVFARAIQGMAPGEGYPTPNAIDRPPVLPDPLQVPTNLQFFWDWARERNRMLRVRTDKVDGRCVLDFYLIFNDGETSYHGRIHEDGREEALENYEWQVGLPILATPEETQREHERIRAQKLEVARILERKGLLL
jgi:hypothetical protein